MGCDIHLWVERRQTYENEKGVREWERVFPPASARKIPWRIERKENTWEDLDAYSIINYATRWYDDRNYDLFGMLANVRNGSGFAGIPMGDGFVPICEPKGWPKDLSRELKHILKTDCPHHVEGDVFPGDHSASWLSLTELNAYDWQRQVTRKCGVIPFEQFVERVQNGITNGPETYCGDTWGNNCVTIEEAEAIERMNGGGLAIAAETKLSVRVWWTTTYADAARAFYTRTLPALNTLIAPPWTSKQTSGGFGGPMKESTFTYAAVTPDDIRIVFNFDS